MEHEFADELEEMHRLRVSRGNREAEQFSKANPLDFQSEEVGKASFASLCCTCRVIPWCCPQEYMVAVERAKIEESKEKQHDSHRAAAEEGKAEPSSSSGAASASLTTQQPSAETEEEVGPPATAM